MTIWVYIIDVAGVALLLVCVLVVRAAVSVWRADKSKSRSLNESSISVLHTIRGELKPNPHGRPKFEYAEGVAIRKNKKTGKKEWVRQRRLSDEAVSISK